MSPARAPWRIGVFGHYGNRNLGDEAIIAAVIHNIRRYFPDAAIYGLSIHPDDTAERHHVPAFPIRYQLPDVVPPSIDPPSPSATMTRDVVDRDAGATAMERIKGLIKRIPPLYWPLKVIQLGAMGARGAWRELRFLRQVYGFVRDLDLLIIAGSNQYLDNFGGPGGFPYTLFKWTVLARLAGTRVVSLSVGAGPISARWSERMIRWTLAMAQYRSFRDLGSRQLVEGLGYEGPRKVVPDLAFSLLTGIPAPAPATASDQLVVGLNPMPVYDGDYWPIADPFRYRQYVRKLTDFARRVLRSGHTLVLFITQVKDRRVIDDILSGLAADTDLDVSRGVHVRQDTQVDDLIASLAAMDIVVATRFHGVVLPLLLEKPVLGICYQSKTRELLEAVEQEDCAFPLDTFQSEALWQAFQRLSDDRERQINRIREIKQEYIEQLEGQYREVFGLLTGDSESLRPVDAVPKLSSETQS